MDKFKAFHILKNEFNSRRPTKIGLKRVEKAIQVFGFAEEDRRYFLGVLGYWDYKAKRIWPKFLEKA